MITLTDINRRQHYLAPTAIARVQEACTSSQWHGVCAIVHTFDGQVLEVRERAADIAQQCSMRRAE
ncbi:MULTISPECIES: hypothetical protein [Pseudomonas putida group]|uniref:Uncharacterized protein n=1 Tax=Pseudomonas monteilii TaxID=76759 RepID=A0AAP7FJ68_9PSED|nr:MULTISPECIES: hypothetical protein [Pseudomonas putida group]MCE0933407.1 hypothetical protein [Pseudomonas monteilii]MCE0981678.1 hypothetical protein [Pseudomonas monteilii]MCE1008766.1 hypothetical protein [Pseudomonas monteilii]OAH45523.1 hypothetical protein AYJ70_21085 [Pseudomonas monteilii]RNF66040.1 hypothetical protein EFJ98_25265 [Pseudomonas putida]